MGRSGEEDDVSDTAPALDEAFERMAAASFELPNGFVNHGAMACEALAMLDCTGDIDSWARRFARAGGASVDPVVPAGFEWRQALGPLLAADSVRLRRSRNERYGERLPWRMHGRYDDGRTGPCHMYDASTTSASRSQISTS